MDVIRNLSSALASYPEMQQLVETLTEIFEFMATDEMIALKVADMVQYEQILHDKFPEFCERYFSLFSTVLDGDFDSLDNLVVMVKYLCMVKAGEITMDTANTQIRDELASKYIYPKFGGKQEFEKTIIERSKNNKSRKHGKHGNPTKD